MAIICSSYSTSISGSNSMICGYAIRVYDIKPSSLDIDIQIDGGQLMTIYTGYSAYQYGSVIFSLHLISKNTSNGTAVIDMVVSDNPCNGISCSDICVGNDLYTQRCRIDYDSQNIPTGYTCVPNVIKTPNGCLTTGSISCTSTPSNAQIWLDGINTGQVTPYTLTNISAEMHNITFILAGYNDCGVNVTVTAGGTVNANCTLVSTSQEIIDVEVYYKVPWIYPKLYVDGVLYLFKQDFDKGFADQGYSNYKVQTTIYNETTHIITITIKKTYSLSNLNDNSNINTLLGPIAWGIILIVSTLVTIYGAYKILLMGTEQINLRDATTSNVYASRTIRVNALTTDTSGNEIPLNADWMVSFYSRYGDGPLINMEYPISAGTSYFEITLNEGFSPTLTVTSNNLVHNKSPTDLTINDKGNQVINVIFKLSIPVQTGTVNPKDTSGNPITCGFYIAKYAESGTLIGEGSLQTDGKTAILSAIPNIKAYVIISSCDTTKKIESYHFITPLESWSLDVIVKNCVEAKNTLTVTLQRKQISGAYEFPLPDSVHITQPSGKTLNLISGTDYIPGIDVAVVHDEIEKGSHSVKVVRKDSTIITDTKTVIFNTDCFSSQSLVFDAEPIINTADLTIEVVKYGTTNTISDVNVYIDADLYGYNGKSLVTNNVGVTSTIYGLTYGNHKITLKRNGYKNVTYDLIVDNSTPLTKTYEMDTESQIGTISTSIKLTSNPSGDLIPNNDVKFEGELVYLKSDGSVGGFLVNGSIIVSIKDGTTLVKQYNITTNPRLSLSPGRFGTPTWTLPKNLAKKDLDVTAEFNGSGDYKSSSLTQIFHVTEACCLNLPLIGCIASQTTCNNIRTGAYIAGGLLIGYIGYKIFVKK